MSENNTGPEFLQQKYQLNKDPGVIVTAKHRERRGEKVDQGDFSTRIQNYLDRLNTIIDPPRLEGHARLGRKTGALDGTLSKKARNLSMIKKALYKNFVTTPEDIPESYYDSIKRKHREEGHGDIEIPEDYRQELTQTIIEDQKRSLDLWVDYLTSDDAKYHNWLKYFAFRSVLRMGNYDKSKGVFNERTKGKKTTATFPELNREALAIVLGDIEKKYSGEKAKLDDSRTDFEFTSRYDISADVKQKYLKALENKNFKDLYALAIEEFKPIAEELLKITEGKWVKYPRGSDPKQLVSTISNYGTGWCLRGEAMASRYLVRDQYDLYVYYSKDQEGNPVVPRLVMVVNKRGDIAEFRGVATQENHDDYIGDVVDAKLSEPEFEEKGRIFKKKSADMKTLTAIDNKVKTGQELSAQDLVFLYEIDSSIEGFGYEKDPRIVELRSKRNPEEDMLVVFGCDKSQIARSIRDIRSDTKAYVGPLETGIFDVLSKYNIEHVYTSFPEGRIQIESLEIGGKDFQKSIHEIQGKLNRKDHLTWQKAKEILEKEIAGLNPEAVQFLSQLAERQINISRFALDMLENPDFTTLKEKQQITIVRLKVKDLDLNGYPTTNQVYSRAAEFGLDLCLPEVGIYQRLKDINQSLGDPYYIGMKQIADSRSGPRVFGLGRREGVLWLLDRWAEPDDGWDPGSEFVFSLRKKTQNS